MKVKSVSGRKSLLGHMEAALMASPGTRAGVLVARFQMQPPSKAVNKNTSHLIIQTPLMEVWVS